MSPKPKFADEWFEWFQREELPRIYNREKGIASSPGPREISNAMEFLRREMAKRDKADAAAFKKQPPLDWKLDREDDED